MNEDVGILCMPFVNSRESIDAVANRLLEIGNRSRAFGHDESSRKKSQLLAQQISENCNCGHYGNSAYLTIGQVVALLDALSSALHFSHPGYLADGLTIIGMEASRTQQMILDRDWLEVGFKKYPGLRQRNWADARYTLETVFEHARPRVARNVNDAVNLIEQYNSIAQKGKIPYDVVGLAKASASTLKSSYANEFYVEDSIKLAELYAAASKIIFSIEQLGKTVSDTLDWMYHYGIRMPNMLGNRDEVSLIGRANSALVANSKYGKLMRKYSNLSKVKPLIRYSGWFAYPIERAFALKPKFTPEEIFEEVKQVAIK